MPGPKPDKEEIVAAIVMPWRDEERDEVLIVFAHLTSNKLTVKLKKDDVVLARSSVVISPDWTPGIVIQ